MDPLAAFTQIMQALGAPLTLLVAVFTLKGKGDDKTATLTKMQVDIEYIKKTVDCVPAQSTAITALDASCKAAHKRLDDHLRYDHGQKTKEETP
jgi:hypothetical protein